MRNLKYIDITNTIYGTTKYTTCIIYIHAETPLPSPKPGGVTFESTESSIFGEKVVQTFTLDFTSLKVRKMAEKCSFQRIIFGGFERFSSL